jgi:hypothetical protein
MEVIPMGRKKKRLRLLAKLAKKAAPAPKPIAALKAKPAPAPKVEEPKVEEPKKEAPVAEEKHECDEDPCTHEEEE